MDHTECKPPVNLQPDKRINFHRTRQFTSNVTVVPEPPKLLIYIYLGSRQLRFMLVLVLLKVTLKKLILGISREIKWKVEALIYNIFILAFLHILQKLSIFQINIFVRGILSICEVQCITTFVKTPVFPGQFKSRQVSRKFFLNSTGVKIMKIFFKSPKIWIPR